jgi:hypothetical protein
MTENLHSTAEGWVDFIDQQIATDLVTCRIAIERTIGDSRRRFADRYDGLLHAAADAWEYDPDAVRSHVEACVGAEMAQHEMNIRRGRPAEAAAIKRRWVEAVAAYGAGSR